MNHYVLLVKLMNRKLPSEILNILEQWFSITVTVLSGMVVSLSSFIYWLVCARV